MDFSKKIIAHFFYFIARSFAFDEASKVKKMNGKVEQRFKSGLIQATVWKNTSNSGQEFRTISLNKSYRQNNEWKNTNSLGAEDIDKAIQALTQARDYLKSNLEEEIVC